MNMYHRKRIYYKNVYEYLTKYKYLVKELGFSNRQIERIYSELYQDYRNFSYYWLQTGLLEQASKQYDYAMQHFHSAERINPKSYAIKHAIARNYCKYALFLNSKVQSDEMFAEGKRKFLELIYQNEHLVSKPYSIHSLIFEAMNYYNQFNLHIPEEEDKLFMRLLNDAAKINHNDGVITNLQRQYLSFKYKQMNHFDNAYYEYEGAIDE